jgi:hypothetical protein
MPRGKWLAPREIFLDTEKQLLAAEYDTHSHLCDEYAPCPTRTSVTEATCVINGATKRG